MLNLKANGSMSSTFKPKLTMGNKGSLKALWRFTQMEIKEHDHGEEYYFLDKNACDMDICRELNMLCI